MKQLRSSTASFSRWDGRTQSVKNQLAQARLSAMAHIERRLAVQTNSSTKAQSNADLTAEERDGADAKAQEALADATANISLQAYEHDLETRKENLINRFDLMSYSVFGKPLYPEVMPSDDGLFMTDPSVSTTDSTKSRAMLMKTGILSDPNAKLRLTLASDCSMIDIQVDAYGQFLEASYEYDAAARYIPRWLLEALKEGKIGVAEEIIRSSYVDRCLRHLNLCSSLQSQYAEAVKSSIPPEQKFDYWTVPGLAVPSDHTTIHDRLRCLERDMVTLSRLETHKLGVSSLWKGTGWMTMNARGPVLTFFSLPVRLNAVAALLSSPSSTSSPSQQSSAASPQQNTQQAPSSPASKLSLSEALARASEEHISLLEALPPFDAASFNEFVDLPSYTSNVLAPVVLAHLRPGSTLCAGHLHSKDVSREQSHMPFTLKDVDALAFHVEVEQGRVTDPNSLRAIRCAPRSTSTTIASFTAPPPLPSAVQAGTLQPLAEGDLMNFFKGINAPALSSCEDPTQFMDVGVQWSPFAQHDTDEDQHLPLCLKLRLEQDVPFYSSLFYRLRAIAASADPTSLLKGYFSTDEANRTGNVPPAAAEAPKPKKITFRTSKSTTVVSAATSAPAPTSSPFSGTTLASLFARKEAPAEPRTEDVVVQLPISTPHDAFNRAVRCLHTHHTTSTPSALMIHSVSFIDARQLRALVAILRQQSVINALYASCFLDDSAMTFNAYMSSLHKRSSHAHHATDALRSSAGGPSNSRAHLHSSINLNASFDIASPPRNRNKRSRTEMEATGLASPEAHKRTADDAKHHEHLTDGSAEHTCHMSIELSALMEPLFGWSVMVVSNLHGHKSTDSAPSTLFSFAVHVAVDGYLHVVPSDLASVANEQRTAKRLEGLLRATFNIPLALKLWMRTTVD